MVNQLSAADRRSHGFWKPRAVGAGELRSIVLATQKPPQALLFHALTHIFRHTGGELS